MATIYDKLIPHPPLPETSGPAPVDTRTKPPLTDDEQALLDRSKTFIANALRSHGIGLSATEIPYMGALVADFVQAEVDSALAAVKSKSKSKALTEA